ncbi:hypothetical protein [Hoeflea sp.]|nr:hypothetical protein [Hoeflea sp.]
MIEMKIEPTDIAMVIGERDESEVVLFSLPLSALICSIEHELY